MLYYNQRKEIKQISNFKKVEFKMKMWTSITKKEFIETLSNRETILAGYAPDYSDKRCVNAMKRITPKQAVERFKTVMEKSNDYILLSDGEYIGFNPFNIKGYFSYKNKYGIHFLIQKTECYNYFDGESYTDYIAYII